MGYQGFLAFRGFLALVLWQSSLLVEGACPFFSTVLGMFLAFYQQTRVYPYPLGAGSARPNPKVGSPDPENPLFLGFPVLRGGLRPWSQTMVSEGARPRGWGRSGDSHFTSPTKQVKEGQGNGWATEKMTHLFKPCTYKQ